MAGHRGMTVKEMIEAVAAHECPRKSIHLGVEEPRSLKLGFGCGCGEWWEADVRRETVGPHWAKPLLDPRAAREVLCRYLVRPDFLKLPAKEKRRRLVRRSREVYRQEEKEHEERMRRLKELAK